MVRKIMILIAGFVFILGIQGAGFAAVNITGGMPVIYDSFGNPVTNADIDQAWLDTQTQIHNELDKYTDQFNLARGFANSGVYASQIANQNGYTGYDLYFVTIGTQVGVQSPSINPYKVKGAFADIENKGDLYTGAAWQIWALQVGVNADFLLKDLYLGVKFGYADIPYKDFNFKGLNVGLLANYLIFTEAYKGDGGFVWRGLSVGSGLIFSKNDTDYNFSVDKITQTIGGGSAVSGAVITYTPGVTIGFSSYAVSIPMEISTAIRLLWCLNMNLGFGMDLSMGGSKIALGIDGMSDVENLPVGYTAETQKVVIDGGTDGKGPHIARPRLMSGIGFEIGAVVLDFPVAWYFNKGFTAGVTAGFRW